MTVIVALLILLTVVVVRRLTAPDPDELATATPADRERQEKEKLAAAEQEKSSADPRSRADDPPSQGKRFASSQATIVPPKAESAKPPKAGDGDSDPGSFPETSRSNRPRGDKSKPLEGSGPPPLPPLFMTVPPKSTASSMPKAGDVDHRRAAQPLRRCGAGRRMPTAKRSARRRGLMKRVDCRSPPTVLWRAIQSELRAQFPLPIASPATSGSSKASREAVWAAPRRCGRRNANVGGRTYTVASGDTLFSIARYELGKASRWAEIYDMNRDVLGKNFSELPPGTR